MIWMTEFICGLALTSLTGSLLFLCRLLIGRYLDRAGYASMLYRFLKIVAFFFLIPVVFMILWSGDQNHGFFGGTLFASTPYVYNIFQKVLWVWILVCVWSFLHHVSSLADLCELEGDAFLCPERIYTCCREICIQMQIPVNRVAIYYSYRAQVPYIRGLFRPRILLPAQSYSDQELRVILTHELIHYKQRDLWLKWGAVVVLCVHWFNPLAWWFAQDVKHWSEYMCDQYTVASVGSAKQYVNVIAAMMTRSEQGQGYFSAALFEEEHELVKRVKRMQRDQKMQIKPEFVCALVCFLMCVASTGTVYAASVGVAERYTEVYEDTAVIVEESGEYAGISNANAFYWCVNGLGKESELFWVEKGQTIIISVVRDNRYDYWDGWNIA